MSERVSGFRTSEDAEEFRRRYEQGVIEHWPPVPRQDLDVRTPFGTTHVRRSGDVDATPIVMIHPTMGGSLGLAPFIEALTRRHPVYTPDTIGTPGLSVQTAPVRSGRDLADWLDATLDELHLDRVHLVGYSEGGYVAALAAALSPRRDRFATVTLIEPGGAIGDLRKSTFAAIVWSGLRVMAARDKRTAMRRVGRWLNGGTYELSDDMVDLVLMSVTRFRQRIPRPAKLSDDEMGRISAPVNLMLGEHSRLFDAAKIVDRAQRLLPDVTTYIEPGGGHAFGFDNPTATMARVLDFIGDHEAASDCR